MTSPIFLDILLIAILILFAVLGSRKGFILTLCSLVAVVVALVGANLVADILAPKVADALQPKIEQVIVEQLNEALKHTEFTAPEGGVAASSEEIPLSGVLNVLRENELYKQFLGGIEDALNEGVAATAASAAARVAAAVAGQLARSIIFILAFFIILIAWGILSHVLDLVSKLPVINGLNHTLGGVLGFVKGLVICYLLVWLLYGVTGYVTSAVMDESYIFRFMALHSPLELLHLS